MTQIQLDWIVSQITQNDKLPVIFMHHPPCITGVLFMDNKYPFLIIDEFQQALVGVSKKIYIFCGHSHTEKQIMVNNLLIYICPSSAVLLNPENPKLEFMLERFGWQEITITEGQVFCEVHYLKE